jgi:hypothetical protein
MLCLSALVFAGCATQTSEESTESAAGEQDLTASRARLSDCPGSGWQQPVQDWFTFDGFYRRTDEAPSGELSMVKFYTRLDGYKGYARTVDGFTSDGTLGIDSARGRLGFYDFRGVAQDVYVVVGQQRGPFLGDIVGLCLVKQTDGQGNPIQGSKPFGVAKSLF